MQFALFSHVPWPEGVDPYRIVSETTEQVQYGEELGFRGAWFAEHHFSRYGLGSSLVLAAHIAARTSTISRTQYPHQFSGVAPILIPNTPACATRGQETRSVQRLPHQAGREGR